MHQRSTASPPRKWLTVMVVFLFLCGCLPNPVRAPKPTGVANRTTPDLQENVRVLPTSRSGSDVGADAATANQAVAAPIISHNGGSAIQGVVRVPAHIISHNGGSIISHNGGAIIGNNGGSIISHNGGSIISHNGGSIIGNNGGSFRVPQVPLANAVVRLKDAAGAPVLDSFGKAIVTQTDAQGNYAFPVAVSGRNLIVHAEVPGQTGNLVALLPKDGVAQGAAIEVDLASTLTLAYVLEQYVKGNLATFERLTQEIEIKARVQTEEAIVKGAIALPETLDQGAIVAKVEEVRKAVPAVDQVFDEIRRMLVIAGIRNQGDGFPGKEVPLGLVGGLIAGDSGEVYIYSQSRQTLWKLDQNGILNTLVPGGMWGYPQELPDSWFPGYHSGMAFDSAGNLLIADVYHNRIVRVAPDRSVSLVAGGDQTGFSGDGGAASAARLNRPTGLAVDSLGYIYFSDTENHCVRRIRPDGVIERFAGTGAAGESGDGAAALNATLNRPQGLLIDSDGSLLIADYGNNKIRRVSKDRLISNVGNIPGVIAMARKNEVISAISHNGAAYLDIRSLVNKVELGSNFNRSLATRGDDTLVDSGGGLVLALEGNQAPTVVAGLDSNSVDAGVSFQYANALAIDESGNVFVADMRARKIFKVQSSGEVETYAGNGMDGYSIADQVATNVAIGVPCSLSYSADQGLIFGTVGNNPSVRRVSHAGVVSVLAGNGSANELPPQMGIALEIPILNPYDVIHLSKGTIAFSQYEENRILEIAGGQVADYIPAGSANAPLAFAIGPEGDLYFVERHIGRLSVIRNGERQTILDDSNLGGLDSLARTEAIAFMSDGSLLVASRKLVLLYDKDGRTRVLAGNGGLFLNGSTLDESLSQVTDIKVSPTGDLYILEVTQLNKISSPLLSRS